MHIRIAMNSSENDLQQGHSVHKTSHFEPHRNLAVLQFGGFNTVLQDRAIVILSHLYFYPWRLRWIAASHGQVFPFTTTPPTKWHRIIVTHKKQQLGQSHQLVITKYAAKYCDCLFLWNCPSYKMDKILRNGIALACVRLSVCRMLNFRW